MAVCYAHLRRKVDEAVKSLPKGKMKGSSAAQRPAYCKLSDCTPEEKYNEQLKQAKPVLATMLAWANTKMAAPKSALVQAFTYLH